MKTVITYGTFDLFHFGHLRLLKRAKKLGDFLIVGVSTDEFNAVKNKVCICPFGHRVKIVKAIRYVDKIIPERAWEQKWDDIRKYKADILVMGDDWKGKFDNFKKICKVVYLPRTPNISSTKIKADIKSR